MSDPLRMRWWRQWAGASLAAAIAATLLDAVRLTAGSIAAIVAGSLADLIVAAGPAAVVLWGAGRLRMSRVAGMTAAALAGFAPALVAHAVSWRLSRFFGDSPDVGLLFDLANRQLAEVFAVGSREVAWLMGLAIAALGLAAAAIGWAMRRRPAAQFQASRVPIALALGMSIVLLAAGAGLRAAARRTGGAVDAALQRKPSGRILALIGNRLSDWDRDGYGILAHPPDSAPFTAAIHPYAIDVPGNGIDEDGLAGDLPEDAAGQPLAVDPAAQWISHPDVVLIMLETFRADVLGAAVGDRPVTPVLDALAARGAATSRAFSHNGHTVRSRYHLFTGRMTVRPGAPTLVDDFKANGYETAYFSAQDESFGGADLDVGFHRADVAYDARADRVRRYSLFDTPGSLGVSFDVLHARIARFLESRARSRPLFLYANIQDAHFPYTHSGLAPIVTSTVVPESSFDAQHAAAIRAMYLNTAANVDRSIGALVDSVARALGHPPAVIVLGDHGESLFDDGFLGHGYALNDIQTRIPLVVAGLPMVLEEPVGQADLRAAIGAAMRAPNPAARPMIAMNPGRTVFQYLGGIERAAAIGTVSAAGRRVTYDVRSDRFQRADGPWQSGRALRGEDAEAFTALVRAWERLLLEGR